jgi:hypothetical protein
MGGLLSPLEWSFNHMKYILFLLVFVRLLTGCASVPRSEGEPYSGYSCRESLMHFNSFCTDTKLTNEEFEAKVQECEKDFATKICEKEQVDLLRCLGRANPGIYSSSREASFWEDFFGHGSESDGCDCSTFLGALEECQIKKGVF